MISKTEILNRIEKLENELKYQETTILAKVSEQVSRAVEDYFNRKCYVAVEQTKDDLIKAEVRRKISYIKDNFDEIFSGEKY